MSKFLKTITRAALVAVVASGFAAFGASAAAADTVEITVVGSNGSGGMEGFVPPGSLESGIGVPPATDVPYPTSDPVGWDPFEGNASLFRAETRPGGEEVLLYCAEIFKGRVENYTSVTRTIADIGNAGYVSRLVTNYFPATEVPTASDLGVSGQGVRSIQATVVQSAIWYFTDGFVVAEASPFHDAVEKIVNDTIATGELPDGTIDRSFARNGPSGPFDVGTVVGPFRVSSNVPDSTTFTVDAGAAKVFRDALGTSPVATGTALTANTPFWLRSDVASTFSVQANGTILAASGLYFVASVGPGSTDAQTLMSATKIPYLVEGAAQVTFNGALEDLPKPPQNTPQPPSDNPTTEVLAETGSGAIVAAPWLIFALLGVGAVALVSSRVARRRHMN